MALLTLCLMEKSNLPFEQLPGMSAGGQGGEEEGEGGPAQQLSRHDDGHYYHWPQ